MASLSNREVGVRIRQVRESRNMTLEFVAHLLGMTKSNYSKYERGEIKKIDRELLIRLSNYLNYETSSNNTLITADMPVIKSEHVRNQN